MLPLHQLELRVARFDDVDQIQDLIALSARELSRGFYSDRQIEAAIAHVFGVDTTLIADGTYFVAKAAGLIQGWSKRRTLFGGDQYQSRDSALSDPAVDSAKIRAFFVHPRSARSGIGQALLVRCEAEGKMAGYKSAELMSTLPGVSFYRAHGYVPGEPTTLIAGDGVEIEFVPMKKLL
jgi:N-acetylglutamate synthase-like GNAT family acetyltransferase